MTKWNNVDASLPKPGEYVIVLEDDHVNPYDLFWTRMFKKPAQRVRVAQLRYVDAEGAAYWQFCQSPGGYPMGQYNNVTYWMAMPEVPTELIAPEEDFTTFMQKFNAQFEETADATEA